MLDYNEDYSEEEQIELVKEKCWVLQYITSERVKLAAVNHYGPLIRYIKNPSEQVQLEAIKQNGWSIQHIKNPSVNVILFCLSLHMNIPEIKDYCLKLLRKFKQK
jgi:hypothetical protein